ncbi:MAG: glycine/betaine ABC transporter substrate-binding protein [Gordonia sp.]|uniref:ABC transporter substrate-binding protein n=1 Tax=Gordonia rubripertincta TaxID=36822 RepID=A0ABT4MSI8_GORRU|nr:ABC transporter substrate-binding protein [Gordonia rubripertincta]MBA4021876.1 glycine/betaine ABC transporter substrate-binding protein [Gordonia sp. (in: high G+C Gram-positive bacteria)]MCZ4549973.1 ABC transporter substrate-binding protein [Gordonia rubripertincta]
MSNTRRFAHLRRRWVVLVAALSALTLTLGLASCSDDESDGKTITVGYQAFPSGDLVVKNQKWLEEALPDYTIKWTKFESGATINQAFIGNSIDIGAIGSSPVARGLSGNSPIGYKVAFVLDVAGDNEALVARNGTNINSVAELKGKTIGTALASTAHYSLLVALEQAGLSANDVKIVDLQPQAIIAAWERGDIDAAYTWLPTLDELRKTGKDLVTSRAIGQSNPTLDLGVVSNKLISDDPAAVDAWRKVQARALDLINTDPAAAAGFIGQELGISAEEAQGQLKQGIYLTPAQVASPQWLGTPGAVGNIANNLLDAAEFLVAQKQIDSAPTLEQLQEAIYVEGLPGAFDQ